MSHKSSSSPVRWTCKQRVSACAWLLSLSASPSARVDFLISQGARQCPQSTHKHIHLYAHVLNHRSFSFWPTADGRPRTTIKYGFTSCFHRQVANYLQVPVAVCCELPPTASINLTSFGPHAYPLLSSLASASPLRHKLRANWRKACLRTWSDIRWLFVPLAWACHDRGNTQLMEEISLFKHSNWGGSSSEEQRCHCGSFTIVSQKMSHKISFYDNDHTD